jgi:hypothetical protein
LLKEVKRRKNFSKSVKERSSEILAASSLPEYLQGDFCELVEAALESAGNV